MQGVHLSGVDLLQVVVDQVLQATEPGHGLRRRVRGLGVPEVEALEPVRPVLLTTGDLVELVLHRGGELVVHQRAEVVLQQADHGEGGPARHQRRATGDHVPAVLDGVDDRGVGRRTADTQLLHRLDQRGLRVARRRLGLVTLRRDLGGVQRIAHGQHRQRLLGVVGDITAVGGTGGLHVGLEEAGEGDRAAGGLEIHGLATRRLTGDRHLHRGALGVRHLGRHGALPDQLVELELLGVQLGRQRARGLEGLTGGADRLVGLLRVLHLAGVLPRGVRDERRAVQFLGLLARRGDTGRRERRRVGTHIGDVAVLVETLRDAHRPLRGEVQLAPGLLLQRRGHERRVGTPRVRLLLHIGDRHGRPGQRGRQRLGTCLVQHRDIGLGLTGLQLAVIVEVTALGDACTVDGDEVRVELSRVGGGVLAPVAGVQRRGEIPIAGPDERHPLALAADDDAGGDGLHTAGGQPRHDLLPQHRGDLVAVEPVEDAAGLLGVHQVEVEFAGVLRGLPDRLRGDLVEDHAPHRHLGLENLEQVPGDGLALTVGVCREQEFVGLLQLRLEVGDLLLLVRADDVQRLEVVVDVHAETRPLFFLVLGRHIGGAPGQVADMTDRGLDDETIAEELLDLLRFRGRLHDHELLSATHAALRSHPVRPTFILRNHSRPATIHGASDRGVIPSADRGVAGSASAAH